MSSERPLISVVMAVYNGGAYIKNAIDSILRQTYTNLECIVINDGSRDGTQAILKSIDDHRIVVIENEWNLGLIESLNLGLMHAKGDFIARMDADDESLPTRLEEQLKKFQQHPEAIAVGCDYYLWSGRKLKKQSSPDNSAYLKTLLLFSPCFAHPTVMMRNVYRLHNLSYNHDFVHAEDFKLWTDLALLGEFRNVTKPLFKYREHEGQVSAQYRLDQLERGAFIRHSYLQKLGFSFNYRDLDIHSVVANNQIIRFPEMLHSIEGWLLNLVKQNKEKQIFPTDGFNKGIHKFWFDSCGYTSLGLSAYDIYKESELCRITKTGFFNSTRLMIKCLIRKYLF